MRSITINGKPRIQIFELSAPNSSNPLSIIKSKILLLTILSHETSWGSWKNACAPPKLTVVLHIYRNLLKTPKSQDRERWIDEWRDVVRDLTKAKEIDAKNTKEDFYFINKEIDVTITEIIWDRGLDKDESFHDFTERFVRKYRENTLQNQRKGTTTEPTFLGQPPSPNPLPAVSTTQFSRADRECLCGERHTLSQCYYINETNVLLVGNPIMRQSRRLKARSEMVHKIWRLGCLLFAKNQKISSPNDLIQISIRLHQCHQRHKTPSQATTLPAAQMTVCITLPQPSSQLLWAIKAVIRLSEIASLLTQHHTYMSATTRIALNR